MKPDRDWDVVLIWTLATVAGLVIGIVSILTLVTGLALGEVRRRCLGSLAVLRSEPAAGSRNGSSCASTLVV